MADAATSAVVLDVSAQHARATHRTRGDGLMSEVLSVGWLRGDARDREGGRQPSEAGKARTMIRNFV
jgi:hypothetical protein